MNVIKCVTNDNKVYAIGSNSNGILGFGQDNEVKQLTIVEELCNKSIIEFKNRECHTIARTYDGKLYCWGKIGVEFSGMEEKQVISYINQI